MPEHPMVTREKKALNQDQAYHAYRVMRDNIRNVSMTLFIMLGFDDDEVRELADQADERIAQSVTSILTDISKKAASRHSVPTDEQTVQLGPVSSLEAEFDISSVEQGKLRNVDGTETAEGA